MCLAEAVSDGSQVYLQALLSLCEVLCGITAFVWNKYSGCVFRHPCVLIRQQTTYHFKHQTRNIFFEFHYTTRRPANSSRPTLPCYHTCCNGRPGFWNHHVEYMMMNEYTLGVFLLYIFLEVETGFSSLVRLPLFIAS